MASPPHGRQLTAAEGNCDDIVGIHERIDAQGEVVIPVSRKDIRRAVDALLGRPEIEGVAVSLLNAWANPEHEELVVQHLQDAAASSGKISLARYTDWFATLWNHMKDARAQAMWEQRWEDTLDPRYMTDEKRDLLRTPTHT